MTWAWFAPLDESVEEHRAAARTAAAQARATSLHGASAGLLAAWAEGPRPVRHAVRVDEDVLDQHGPPATVSLVLVPAGREPLFDDPAVCGAMRAVLSGPPPDGVTTFTRDALHFAGGLTVRRRDPWALRDDPFARLHPARLLLVSRGLLAEGCPPIGPVVQRYAGQPWPAAGFDT
jgi:hypothetical protein